MGAPKGNRFWELASKHGRSKIFATPAIMWEAACEYFLWCEDNPLIAIEYYGKDAERCEVPKMRPFTMQGLCFYLDCNTGYFNDFNEALKGKKDKTSKEFSAIVTRIRETVYRQKFEGAASGFLNANIIARDLGLTDKQQIDGNANITVEIV